MNSPTLISGASPFPISEVFVVILRFYLNFEKALCQPTLKILIRRRGTAACDLGMQCLPLSHKRDASLGLYGLSYLIAHGSFLFLYFFIFERSQGEPAPMRSRAKVFAARSANLRV